MAIIGKPREDYSPQRRRDAEKNTRKEESTEVAESAE
jgi:hypothetical protein